MHRVEPPKPNFEPHKYEEHKPPRRIGHWPESDKPYLEQAAEETGYDIRIRNERREERVTVWTYDERRDLSPFWRKFEELKEA